MDGWVIFKVAVIALGLVQFVKEGILATIKDKVPVWVWAAGAAVLCMVTAAMAQYLPPWVINGLLGVALMQVGYETLFKMLKAIVERVVGGNGK